MQYKTIVTDENLLEQIQYPACGLPVFFCQDHLDDFLNGDIGYHWHDDLEFGYGLQGEAECQIHREQTTQNGIILKPGDGLFVNSKSLHRIRQRSPGTILLNFVIPANLFALLPMREAYRKNILPVTRSPIAGFCLLSENAKDTELLNLIKEFLNLPPGETGYELHCIELLCRLWRQLLIRILQTEQPIPVSKTELLQEERLRLMLSYIHANYSDNITADTLAQAAGISRSECFRCFRAVIGMSPSDYLCQYRLSQAARLLSDTDMELSDICYSCGFRSTSYFGKVFRENCGISPGRYRESARKTAGSGA